MKLVSPIVILLFLYGASGLKYTSAGCENDSWYAFRDEKCLKVVEQLLTHDDAKQFCIDQFVDSTLIRINSIKEQEFVTKLLFDSYQLVDNVWLGAIRKTDNASDFVWEDQSELGFTWWADGSPSGNFTKNCTQLKPHFPKSMAILYIIRDENDSWLGEGGQWMDAPCSRRNLVVCQKRQNWNVTDAQDAVLELRVQVAELKETVAEHQAQLAELKETDAVLELRIEMADLSKTDTELRVQVAELKKTAAELRVQVAELKKTAAEHQVQKETVAELIGNRPKNCDEVELVGSNTIYEIYPFGSDGPAISVQCDFETGGGNWTIIHQRSLGPKKQFYLNWTDYEEGFGDVDGNYWIGLKAMNSLTSQADQELRVELEDWEGNRVYAEYDTFKVGNASDLYRLTVRGYSGNAGDSMTYHNGRPFSTRDKDNDAWSEGSCALKRHGAWWFGRCGFSCLNGYYYPNSLPLENQGGLHWYHWKGKDYSLKSAQMKIREGNRLFLTLV